jgi:hypothetical protein
MAEVMNHRSSFIAQTSYDHNDQTLRIEFTDGKTFEYPGVPHGSYTSLITSPSVGRAFHTVIKDRFTGEEV